MKLSIRAHGEASLQGSAREETLDWSKLSVDIRSRSETKAIIEEISNYLQLSSNPKLIDFELDVLPNGCGTGIVQVKLPDYLPFREYISEENSLEKIGISSLTSSGKIRLVRERLSSLN